MPDQRRWWLCDLTLLAVVCALIYLAGVGAIGLTTWQEAQRAAAAREMWRADEWVVPLINGLPYLAKPPLFYWVQMAITPLVGHEPSEVVLHLTSALFAALGIFATYIAARLLLREGLLRGRPVLHAGDERAARGAALLGALCLATGPAYVYGGHLGEIDIAQPVTAVLGVGGLGLAWVRHLRTGRLAWTPLAVGTLGCVLAALIKGPPALGVVLAGVLGGVLLHAAYADGAGLRTSALRWRLLGGALGALATVPFTVTDVRDLRDAIGAIMAAAIGWGLGVVAARVAHGARLALLARGLWSIQPWFSLGLPVAAFAWWSMAVVRRLGDQAVERFKGEVESNIYLLTAKVPTLVAGDAVWSVGLGSVLAIAALVWLWRHKPALQPGGFLLLAWLLLGLTIFALLGKGVPRYLLPVWPAMALVGGAWGWAWMRGDGLPRRRALVAITLGALAAGEVAWYGYIRPRVHAHWSPRELVHELLGPAHRINAEDLATYRFWTAAIDYYAEAHPLVVGDANEKAENVGGTVLSDQAFVERLRSGGKPVIVLTRENDRPDLMKSGKWKAGPERLRALGLHVEEIKTQALFEFDNGRSKIIVLRVSAGR